MTTAVTTASTATPSSTTSSASTSGNAVIASGQKTLSSSYDTFLKLLTTQLQHQDPTSPLDTNAFTQQLVQMTGVQQQLNTNELLQKLVNQSGGGQGVTSSVGLIGKSVVANTANVTLNNGAANWQYNLGSGAVAGTVSITNAAGRTVWSGPMTSLAPGNNSFSWDGRDASGRQLPDGGTYTLNITAQNAATGAVTATPQVAGVVTSIEQDATGATVLGIGKTKVPIASVSTVTQS
jgi:flagellar basal-body rod modification protein FlgD